MCCCKFSRCVPTWDLKNLCKKKPCKCVGFRELPICSLKQPLYCCCRTVKGSETISLIQENGSSTKNYNTLEDGKSQTGMTVVIVNCMLFSMLAFNKLIN